jgi:tripartite-type tricarboxylate transporter receptor subunit TctC
VPLAARAQIAYPSRSIKILVPAPPAGITDYQRALIADDTEKRAKVIRAANIKG